VDGRWPVKAFGRGVHPGPKEIGNRSLTIRRLLQKQLRPMTFKSWRTGKARPSLSFMGRTLSGD
jgi:hypothetical protein